MLTLDYFLPFVLPFANGVSKPTALAAVRDATITFCKRTLIWRDWLQPSTVTMNQPWVQLYPGQDAQLWLVEQVYLEGRELKPRTEDALRDSCIRPNDPPGPPWLFTFANPDGMKLLPVSDRTIVNGLLVRAALLPARSASSVPDFLFNQYAREIADGALAILHSSAEVYAQPAQQVLFSTKFEMACGTTAVRAARSDTRSPLRTKPCFN